MGRCSPCLGPRTRAVFTSVLQLILGLFLIALHSFCLMKIVNEAQVYGPFFRALTNRQVPEPSFRTYHITSLILAIAMVIFTMIFCCGMCKSRSGYICAWVAANWILVICYAVMVFYSWQLLVLGFFIENILVIGVTINFICCVNPFYEEMKVANK